MNSTKTDLANAYRIIDLLGMNDHTYTHISSRPKEADFFYMYQFGLNFSEVTEQNILTVSFDGEILDGEEYIYNKTGYVIHSSIYKERKDVNAIFHLHTPSTVAVSSMKRGLLPISQWALHFYDAVSYHNYNSLALDHKKHCNLTQDLGNNYTMLLRNHGSITCGKTVQEAMFYSYHLEKACQTQCLALQSEEELVYPSDAICKEAVKDLLSFEKDLGRRDWEAWLRLLKKSRSK